MQDHGRQRTGVLAEQREGVVLGSSAAGVVHDAPCAVLVLPRGAASGLGAETPAELRATG